VNRVGVDAGTGRRLLARPGRSVTARGRRWPEDLSGLRAFGTDYPEAKRILLHRGPHALDIDGIPCLRVDEFLLSLVPERGPGES